MLLFRSIKILTQSSFFNKSILSWLSSEDPACRRNSSAMLASIKLPFYPTTTDCLAWSEDGELAIAAGESVHLLVLTSCLS